MRFLAKAILVAPLLLSSTGCYHTTVVTGLPEGGTVVNQPWAMSFVGGLIPPKEVNTAAQCPGGVAKVETQHSFLNLLVGSLTGGLITPMTITVTCAGTGAVGVHREAPMTPTAGATTAQAVEQAAAQAAATGEPVLVRVSN